MFDSKQKEAYSAVKAPQELRKRILSSADNEKKSDSLLKTQFSRVLAAAACLALVAVAVFTVFTGNRFEVSVDGSVISENSSIEVDGFGKSPVVLARSFVQAEVELTLKLGSDALITVDSGSFDIDGVGTNLTEHTADDDVEIIWRTCGIQKSEMTIDYGRKTCVLVLEYNDGWVITRK